VKHFVTATLFALSVGSAFAQRPVHLTDDQVRTAIIHQSIADYQADGRHPCACPYNSARNGSSCGGRSAYSRPGGVAPLCYARDVTAGMVADWRRSHGG
jgi:hypothetical protein